jgi:hypothetical protein
MRSYVNEVKFFYGKHNLREYIVPATGNLFQVDDKSEALSNKAKLHSIVAKLLYLGKCGRPDILMPAQFLCTRVQAPMKEDATKLERVLGYLKFSRAWTSSFDRSEFKRVTTYIDASFAVHPDGKGQSACVVMLGSTLAHEVCRKKKIVTKNSMEAEMVALANLLIEGELVEDFIMDLGHLMGAADFITDVHLVYQNNKSTLAMVTTGGGKPRTKYMKVRKEYAKEHLKTWEVVLECISTKQMLADLLTKPLGGELYRTMM